MEPNTIDTEVAIVGGGLCGLATAVLLAEAGRDVRLIEARDHLGGRIRSVRDAGAGDYLADLGPTWIWPSEQPVVVRWIGKMDLETFAQYESGKAILDFHPERQPEAHHVPGQAGSVRLQGGPQAFIDALARRLADDACLTGYAANSITTNETGVEIAAVGIDDRRIMAEQVVIAVPPRIARHAIDWHPALPAPLAAALDDVPTWMAPHAKVVAIYERPFWREGGLSGRIASQAGPIVEGHDHCGPDGTPAAIFGFIGWPHDLRHRIGADLVEAVRDQLKRCFGPDSPDPLEIHLEDWAADPLVATPADLSGPMSHPDVAPDVLRQPHADGRVWFAGAETATRSPGLIEGAFDAAERIAASLA